MLQSLYMCPDAVLFSSPYRYESLSPKFPTDSNKKIKYEDFGDFTHSPAKKSHTPASSSSQAKTTSASKSNAYSGKNRPFLLAQC